ncbi:MAG: hypothetical protein U0Y68_08000 [Blastocatellia bacterium]
MLTVILSASLLFSSMFAQEKARELDPKIVPLNGATTKAFVPKGWVAQDEQMGDLNGDGMPDAVLQLIEDLPKKTDEFQMRYRALLILFKTADGKYTRAAVAGSLLMCGGCGGMLGGTGDSPAADVKIEKGVLLVSQLAGSRESTDHLHRFRYNAATKQFLLIGEDITNLDRATGASETISTNYLTGKQVIERHKYNEKTDKDILVSKKIKVVAKKQKPIEQVEYE